ncbi:hypothetical protein I0P70_17665 [Pontibacter sp. FD36]|uniref:hypothetical protein n=1 Tax=Pontibacter sp. FD36 TaxID=2789860 RepID=UPI0018A8871C|nr:hypothetical protein [Pontibacter sp. FD36]MBF8965080.1 hypothetical protein [Pontibacter sp. FD36]
MKQIYVLLACLLFLVCACTFSPSGDNFKEVNPTPENNLKISLADKSDTIFAKDWVRLHFQLEYPGKSFYGYQLLLDGKVIHTVENPVFFHDLLTTQFSDGPHELQLVLVTSSGTNSLADKLRLESMQVYRKWVLMLDNAPPSPVQITSIEPTDGSLRIEWEPYKRRDIKNYRLVRLDAEGYFKASYTLPPHVTSVFDTTYLGGPATYYVTVTDNKGFTSDDSERREFSSDMPGLVSHEYMGTDVLRLTFRGTDFYKNFGSYTISSVYGPALHYKTNTVSDTVITFRDIPLTIGFEFQFYVSPKGPYIDPRYFNSGLISLAQIPGNGIRHDLDYNMQLHASNPELNLLYDLVSETISAVDSRTLQVSHQRKQRASNITAFSNSVKYIYVKEPSNVLLQLDPRTLQTIRSVQLNELLPGSDFFNYGFKVSDNNKLALISYPSKSDNSLYIVDMATGRVELQHVFKSQGGTFTISPDGEAVFVDNDVFRRAADGTWKREQMVKGLYASLYFHPTAPYFIYNDFFTTKVYSTKSNTSIGSFSLGDGVHLYDIDAATGYLQAVGNGKTYIYDIENRRIVKELNSGSLGSRSALRFFKDKLIVPSYYFPIQL